MLCGPRGPRNPPWPNSQTQAPDSSRGLSPLGALVRMTVRCYALCLCFPLNIFMTALPHSPLPEGKSSLRERKPVAPGHTTGKWCGQNLNPGSPTGSTTSLALAGPQLTL